MKSISTFALLFILLQACAQTQSWQWVKAGGSSSDNSSVQPAECKIAGCDAYGNVYAVGNVNGANMKLDTFSSAGSYSGTGAGGSYLLFSYDCAGNMRWAKQIGDQEGDYAYFGAVTDPYGNTYVAGQFLYGYHGGIVDLFLGDSAIIAPPNIYTQRYLCMIKYDSLGRLVWFRNFQDDTSYSAHVGGYGGIYGLRIGSSGNLWMGCALDSDYAISPNLHTTLKGNYNVKVDPQTGGILGGYYTSNDFFGDAYSVDTYWDLDENENYYETGTLNSQLSDTLILANQKIAPNNTISMPYIFSLDKTGNFRYIVTNKNYCVQCGFTACKYDLGSDRLITCWSLNSGDVYGNDTFNFNASSINGAVSRGLFAISPNGNILWGKYMTQTTNDFQFVFDHIPTPFYIDHVINNSLVIYNDTDTIYNGTSLSSNDYEKVMSRIDPNGNLIATHTADEGNLNGINGSNGIKYGATDWRGNVYLGGTVTNFFATPADSVVNTDPTSGNFFIAKLGTSDCSCPTPGVQFTQAVHGDTVYFYGSSINHSDSIRWRLGDGAVSSTDTFTHVYVDTGTYTVTAIAYSGCGVDSVTKLIAVTSVGIKTVEPNRTSLYPNPVTNTAWLDVSGPATIGLIYANGASVWSSPMQVNQSGTYVFDMSRYACAMYYFIVQYTNGKTDVMQVVKE